MSTLQKRLEALEAASGRCGGCERCRGLLVTASHAITGELHSARWNGEAVSEGEFLERRTWAKCEGCGRELASGEAPVIRVGGHG